MVPSLYSPVLMEQIVRQKDLRLKVVQDPLGVEIGREILQDESEVLLLCGFASRVVAEQCLDE